MATIYDIAKTADVSPATVSRVINGRPGVKEETVLRIRKAMEASSFQPRWKAIDRNRILVLLPEHRGALDSGYTSRILSGVCDATFTAGFGLQMRPFVPQIRNNRELRQMIMREGVAGCIIVTMFQGYSLAERLSLAQFPHAIVGYKSQDDGAHQILLDDREAGANATRYLLSLGHRKIAMVSFKHIDHGHEQRFAGYAEAMKAVRDAAKPQCIEFDTATIDSGRSAARRLLGLLDRPTAVIVTNEDLAIGFQIEAREMGLHLPRDLSLIGFEETEKLSYLDTPMTAMRIPAHAMGTEAARMIFSLIGEAELARNKKPADIRTVHTPISLIVRHSTAAI
ncbi:MAG: LacI family DNA-binding transcriptional regulator [Opitutaceae bacterium]|jgi:LacI family transcriptional regulator